MTTAGSPKQDILYDATMALRFEAIHDFKVHRAIKEHRCSHVRCDHQPIEPGEYYVRVVWAAPWFTTQEDEGVYSQVGQWVVSKYHPECLPKPMMWDGD